MATQTKTNGTRGTDGSVIVRLSSSQWIGLLISLVVATAAASTAFYQSLNTLRRDVDNRMIDLDQRWEVRTNMFVHELKDELKDLRSQIPPDWFRNMVEAHTSQLAIIRQEVACIQQQLREIEKLAASKKLE